MSVEWHYFPEGEGPVVLTGKSVVCQQGDHQACQGIGKHDGSFVFCVCPCHLKPGNA